MKMKCGGAMVVLKTRTKAFALRVIKLYSTLPQTDDRSGGGDDWPPVGIR